MTVCTRHDYAGPRECPHCALSVMALQLGRAEARVAELEPFEEMARQRGTMLSTTFKRVLGAERAELAALEVLSAARDMAADWEAQEGCSAGKIDAICDAIRRHDSAQQNAQARAIVGDTAGPYRVRLARIPWSQVGADIVSVLYAVVALACRGAKGRCWCGAHLTKIGD